MSRFKIAIVCAVAVAALGVDLMQFQSIKALRQENEALRLQAAQVAPLQEQLARADVIDRQLDEVVAAFNKFAASQLPGINSKLKAKHLPPINELSEQDWKKASAETGSANAAAAMRSRHLDND